MFLSPRKLLFRARILLVAVMSSLLGAWIVLAVFNLFCQYGATFSAFQWNCVDKACVKVLFDESHHQYALSKDTCHFLCGEYGNLVPRPTGDIEFGNELWQVNINSIDVNLIGNGGTNPHLAGAVKRFKNLVTKVAPEGYPVKSGGKTLTVFLVIKDLKIQKLSLDLDESYELDISLTSGGQFNATVVGNNFFGARNGLETLLQLLKYNDVKGELQLVSKAHITDNPVYPYRGVLLDTARSFYSIESIKRLIDGMAFVKLNTFHWHIIDSHSFPFESLKQPNLTKYGAYSQQKIYRVKEMVDLVAYGLERGVRVLPEFDAPAHVGEGWQYTDLLVCYKKTPWREFCAEPPCGQLNVIREEVYTILGDVYKEMLDIFKPDLFHMGGDEVNENCWSSVDEMNEFIIQNRWEGETDEGFLRLWSYFQHKAADALSEVSKKKKLPMILWTSTLTASERVTEFLPVDDYIIQVWTTGTDAQVSSLLSKGYKLIMSNYDALYLDCGFGAWMGEGNNWCSPYIGWQKVYENSPMKIAGEYKNQILGGEAALWSEQADDKSMDSRIWPRAAALAERLWAEPQTSYAEAVDRMIYIRERLANIGIDADLIQPEWCYANEGNCV